MSDTQQLVLAGIVFAVPVLLIVMHREALLVKWVCLTVAIDVLDPKVVVNLPAARVTGLLLLPLTFTFLKPAFRTRAGKALLARYIYLVLLGVLFGFVFPWPSEGWLRSPTQLAQGRAIVYLIRTAADVTLLLFVSEYILKTKRPDLVVKWMVSGTSIAALGGVFQFLTQIDPYYLVTSLSPLGLGNRMRGLNYEPRGLGLIAAHGFVLCLMLYAHKPSFKRLGLTVLHAIAIFLTVSTSSLFATGAGLVGLSVFHKRSRRPFLIATCAILALSIFLLSYVAHVDWIETWSYNLHLRLTSNKPGSAPTSRFDEFSLRLDIFDASALIFLVAKPVYLTVGAGPGLVSLPATNYVPQAALFDWVWQQGTGLNTAPHTGLLRELSDAGILGLLLWFVFLLSCARALSVARNSEAARDGRWSIGQGAFWVATTIYFVQASPVSAIWPVFLGIGLAATRVLQEPVMVSGNSVSATGFRSPRASRPWQLGTDRLSRTSSN